MAKQKKRKRPTQRLVLAHTSSTFSQVVATCRYALVSWCTSMSRCIRYQPCRGEEAFSIPTRGGRGERGRFVLFMTLSYMFRRQNEISKPSTQHLCEVYIQRHPERPEQRAPGGSPTNRSGNNPAGSARHDGRRRKRGSIARRKRTSWFSGSTSFVLNRERSVCARLSSCVLISPVSDTTLWRPAAR